MNKAKTVCEERWVRGHLVEYGLHKLNVRCFYTHPYVQSSTILVHKTWEQPKCPSTDEWIKKILHVNTIGYYSAKKMK